MILKMEPIKNQRKQELEAILGFEICPHTIEVKRTLEINVSAQVRELLGESDEDISIDAYARVTVNAYKCFKGGISALGGAQDGRILIFAALSPCSIGYAQNCPYYNPRLRK